MRMAGKNAVMTAAGGGTGRAAEGVIVYATDVD